MLYKFKLSALCRKGLTCFHIVYSEVCGVNTNCKSVPSIWAPIAFIDPQSTITVTSTLGGSVTVTNQTKGTSVTSSNGTTETISAINGDSIKITTSLSSNFETYSLKKNDTNITNGYTETM